MSEDEVRKYDKEVLIKFIISEAYFGKSYAEGKLDMLQRHYEVDCLLEKQNKLGEQMLSIVVTNSKEYKKWKRLMNEDQKIHKRINELLGI